MGNCPLAVRIIVLFTSIVWGLLGVHKNGAGLFDQTANPKIVLFTGTTYFSCGAAQP